MSVCQSMFRGTRDACEASQREENSASDHLPCASRRRRVVRVLGAERQSQLAVREHVGAIGQCDGSLGALLDEQHRETGLANRCECLEDDVDDGRREAERGLVEQQHIGLGDERARDRELLLLPTGERTGVAAAELLDDRKEVVDPANDLARIAA